MCSSYRKQNDDVCHKEREEKMKFFHVGDLHLGKQLHGYDLIKDQEHMLEELLSYIKKEQPDAVLIAGDIYDRAVPSGTAMQLLEHFFIRADELAKNQKAVEIILIAGNHDAAKRLQYGSSFMKRHHIHIAVMPPQQEDAYLEQVTLTDQEGVVHFYLLPYTKPGMIRHWAEQEELANTQDAVKFLLEREPIDWNERNVLLSHQFYLHANEDTVLCDSETPSFSVGGLDSIATTLVDKFDYIALGHIHSPQNLGDPHIRYAGTPLKYSVSEADQNKSITVVEMGKKGEISYRYLPIHPLHDVRALRGKMEELAAQCTEIPCHDYVSIVLTDEEAVQQPRDYLEKYYDHILEIQIDNTRTRQIMEEEIPALKEMSLEEAFMTFFQESTGRPMNEDEQKKFAQIIETL